MSDAQKGELAFAVLISLFGGGFLLWGAWCAAWGIYDHFTGHWKRLKNKRFDARASRDCFRDMKGVHK